MEDLIPNGYAEVYKRYCEAKKELDALDEEFKAKLLEAFESNECNTTVVEKDGLKFTYVKGSTRKTIDSKKLQEEEPNIYDKYLKETQVKGSIRTSII